jgi:hypothetical protein
MPTTQGNPGKQVSRQDRGEATRTKRAASEPRFAARAGHQPAPTAPRALAEEQSRVRGG